MDKGTRTVEMMRNLMFDLGLPGVLHPTPFYNNTMGAVDWSQGASLSKRFQLTKIREVNCGAKYSIHLKPRHPFIISHTSITLPIVSQKNTNPA
jgi:hypothetical protein